MFPQTMPLVAVLQHPQLMLRCNSNAHQHVINDAVSQQHMKKKTDLVFAGKFGVYIVEMEG